MRVKRLVRHIFKLKLKISVPIVFRQMFVDMKLAEQQVGFFFCFSHFQHNIYISLL